MWEALGSIFKIFVEKHLIPTIIALVGGSGALIFLPDDYWMLTKVGKTMFFWFVAGALFLLVQLVCAIQSMVSAFYRKKQESEQKQIEAKAKKAEELEELYSFTEKLSSEDRKILLRFITSENTPIEEFRHPWQTNSALFHSDKVIHIERNCSYLIKLKDEFYHEAKKLFDATGSITRFAPEEETEEELPF